MEHTEPKVIKTYKQKAKHIAFLSLVPLLFLVAPTVADQFLSQEIAQRTEIEGLLKTAKIIDFKALSTGVTRPYRLYLEVEGRKLSGAWKNPKGLMDGVLEGWRFEIAAYEMDKLLGLDMIPPTVERVFQGKKGSLQFWIKSEMSDLERMEKDIPIPRTYSVRWNNHKYLMRAFDCLIGNEDRTQENIRYAEDFRIILIDHSRSFRSSRKYTDGLMYGKNGVKEKKLFRRLPGAFVERVKGLTYEAIKGCVGSYLNKKEINAILKRKELLLNEIDDMIKEKGEAAVIY